MILETRTGKRIEAINTSADDYRLNQMKDRGFMQSGELCCRLGIPLIGSETTELKIVVVNKTCRGCEGSGYLSEPLIECDYCKNKESNT